MSRTVLPFAVADITALARSLRGQLLEKKETPGHLALLNMLARAAGFRNFQHFRAEIVPTASRAAPLAVASAPEPARPGLDERALNRLTRYFDASGRLTRWPSKHSHRLPCLWALWAAMPPRQVFDEYGITHWLAERHLFGDPALLRRELCDQGLVVRTRDGREYRRLEQHPTPEGLALIQRLGHGSPRAAPGENAVEQAVAP
jgi:hypothetical protein